MGAGVAAGVGVTAGGRDGSAVGVTATVMSVSSVPFSTAGTPSSPAHALLPSTIAAFAT